MNILYFPPAFLCCVTTVWYEFSLSKSHQNENEHVRVLSVCYTAIF